MCEALNQFKDTILSDTKKINCGVLMHENPDPDSIGSALGIEKVLKSWNSEIKTTFVYSGEISHSQNKLW